MYSTRDFEVLQAIILPFFNAIVGLIGAITFFPLTVSPYPKPSSGCQKSHVEHYHAMIAQRHAMRVERAFDFRGRWCSKLMLQSRLTSWIKNALSGRGCWLLQICFSILITVQVYLPCQMNLVRRQSPRFSLRWTALNALCLFALIISLASGIGSIESIIENLKVLPHCFNTLDRLSWVKAGKRLRVLMNDEKSLLLLTISLVWHYNFVIQGLKCF